MSRTEQKNVNRVPSPFKFYLEYKADRGVFNRWDNDKGENVTYDELKCVFMDSRSSITGWNDANQSRIYSNMVKYTKEEPFVVKVKAVELVTGLYSDVKDEIAKVGGKFTSNLFVLAEIDGVWEPVVVQFHKNSLSNWTNYVEANGLKKIYGQLLTFKKTKDQQKKGKVVWYNLDIQAVDLPQDVATLADEFDSNELRPYLNQTVEEVSV